MARLFENERTSVLAAAQEMARLGLVAGSSGNVSVRLEDESGEERYLVTPAGLPYERMTAADLVPVNGELEPVEGEGIPSSESLMHLAIYRARPDVRSIIHTHSIYASAAAVAGKAIPPILDEMTISIGGQVDVAEYGFPGSDELAGNVVRALGDRRAVLLRNHGLCTAAGSPEEALAIAVLVERVAQIFFAAEAAGGAITLPNDSIETEEAIYRMKAGLPERRGNR